MTACHVVFKVPDGNHRSSGLYEVAVHIKMPGGATVDIDRTPGLDERFSELPVCRSSDAFRRRAAACRIAPRSCGRRKFAAQAH